MKKLNLILLLSLASSTIVLSAPDLSGVKWDEVGKAALAGAAGAWVLAKTLGGRIVDGAVDHVEKNSESFDDGGNAARKEVTEALVAKFGAFDTDSWPDSPRNNAIKAALAEVK
jgi:hypothetical protein